MKRLLFSFLVMFLLLGVGHAGDVQFTLSWKAPTTNADGTPLADLGGFNVYWGTVSGSYTNNKKINDPKITTTIISLPENVNYCFSVTAFDDSGNESIFSNEVCKTKGVAPSGCADLQVK